MRLSRLCRNQWLNIGKGKELFSNLWSKPETRDERVKEYVPEVLEESLSEQRKVLEEGSSRDVIVDAGHKMLAHIENKAPTPSIQPHLTRLLEAYGDRDLIGQRALSRLLYPTSVNVHTALGAASQTPNELESGFVENLRNLVEYVEQNGRSPAPEPKSQTSASEDSPSATVDAADTPEGKVIVAPRHEVEPMDSTLFIKVSAGLALGNVSAGDFKNAVRCCDAALKYAIDPKRIGGLYGMKAGILNRQLKYEEAAEASRLAIEASDNIQGYLQGAASLRALKRHEEAVALLEQAQEAHPLNTVVTDTIAHIQKAMPLALPEADKKAAARETPERLEA